jgi:hypothetical protein
MTQDEIISKAKLEDSIELIEFIKLAILQEREACASICKEMYLSGDMDTGLAEETIRARGQA